MAKEPEDDGAAEDSAPEPTKSRKGLLFMLLPAVLLGSAAFYATFSGMVSLPVGSESKPEAKLEKSHADLDIAYLKLDELVIPLSERARARFLVFQASIETRPEDLGGLELIQPRILDVFNTYLRAVDERELEEPSAMFRLRARLMNRLRAVAAPIEPKELLITTFVLK